MACYVAVPVGIVCYVLITFGVDWPLLWWLLIGCISIVSFLLGTLFTAAIVFLAIVILVGLFFPHSNWDLLAEENTGGFILLGAVITGIAMLVMFLNAISNTWYWKTEISPYMSGDVWAGCIGPHLWLRRGCGLGGFMPGDTRDSPGRLESLAYHGLPGFAGLLVYDNLTTMERILPYQKGILLVFSIPPGRINTAFFIFRNQLAGISYNWHAEGRKFNSSPAHQEYKPSGAFLLLSVLYVKTFLKKRQNITVLSNTIY